MGNLRPRLKLPILVVLAFASVLSLGLASRMDTAFVTYPLIASAWTLVIVLLARREAVRSGALLFSSVFFSLAMIELASYYAARSQFIVTRTTPTTWRHNVLSIGYMPVPNTTTEFKEVLAGRVIADVTYTIDANGLRKIPDDVQGRTYKVAFFGCSFMFGHGVEDNQTLPYYFMQDSGGAYKGYNFAGEGWGPHQMLREIETGFVGRVAGAPDLAIYEAIPDHLRRVAGRAPWEDGPKYELGPFDQASYSGPFHSIYYDLFRRSLYESWTVKLLDDRCARASRASDIPLFLAVLKSTRALLAQNGTRFVVVVWDQNELANVMMAALRKNQFDVIAVSDAFPGGDLKLRPLVQLDRHPSPETNKAIAMYL